MGSADPTVCFITHPFTAAKDTGRGNDRYTYELLSNLGALGIRTALVDPGYYNSLPKALLKEMVYGLKLAGVSGDVYHAICPAGAKNAVVLRKHPLITTIHDMIPFHFGTDFEHPILYKYHRLCTRLSAINSDRIIVPFESIKNELVSRFHVEATKIEVIRYGIDHSVFRPMPDVRDGTGVGKRIVFVGGVTRAHGVDVLIEAFSAVAREIGDVQLTLGGKVIGGKRKSDGEYLKGLPHRLGVGDKVTFLGYVPEGQLPALYNRADVVVFPSSYGFGLPAVEAMACGTPAIAAATLDGPDGYGDAALLVEPRNVRQLAEALMRILSDGKLRADMIGKGLKQAGLFRWDAMAKSVASLYARTLNGEDGGG